jgi:hypothetical protein
LPPAGGAPAARPLPDFSIFIGQIEPFMAELLIIAPGSYNLKGRAKKRAMGV